MMISAILTAYIIITFQLWNKYMFYKYKIAALSLLLSLLFIISPFTYAFAKNAYDTPQPHKSIATSLNLCKADNVLLKLSENADERQEAHENTDDLQSARENADDKLKLHANAAVLIDGDSGRILYSHNSDKIMPMASTTKIMTCIIALEYGCLDDIVTASSNAASQPEVRLGIHTGNQFKLKDLLYSLMLESHNDSAVAIAEHVGGSIEGFAGLMNQKARDLGCFNTYFITPNGLDAKNEEGIHSTTASELALMLRYAIKNEAFLEITKTKSYAFKTIDGKRSFSVTNKNALFSMMDGVISGKTGFTNDAGFCYVGAINNGGRTYIAAVLACGWPPHKAYKWIDVKALFNYGIKNYNYKEIYDDKIELPAPKVIDGCKEFTTLSLRISDESLHINALMREDDIVTTKVDVPDTLNAPVREGSVAGSVSYCINGTIIQSFPVYINESVDKISYRWCLKKTADLFFCS